MRYKKYPSYRDSEVAWLEEIPAHWESTRLCNLGLLTASGIDKKLKEDEPLVHIINFTDIHKATNCKLTSKISYMKVTAPIEKKIAHQVDKGDLIFTPSSETIEDIGISALIDEELTTTAFSYHVLRFHFTNPLNHSYRKYLTNNTFVLSQFSMKARGTTRQTLGRDDFRTINLTLPPIQEQQTIANYLDIATAKIDTLIEKQTKLIELLREKRQAVISTAVTRGLDSTVAMKDSGIKWLGKIPEHWKLPQVARILLLMEQGKSPECDNNVADLDTWGVLKTSCVNNAIYNSEANKTLPSSIQPFSQYEVKEEDILMSRASGSINLIGSVAYVYKTRPKILLSDKIFRLYVDKSVNKIFFTYLMGSEYMRTNIKMAISGGEGMANNIAKSSITKFKMALPSVDEQLLIVKYIDDKTSKMDNLINKSTKAIELLKEKRIALISSAVTGKIDVREGHS